MFQLITTCLVEGLALEGSIEEAWRSLIKLDSLVLEGDGNRPNLLILDALVASKVTKHCLRVDVNKALARILIWSTKVVTQSGKHVSRIKRSTKLKYLGLSTPYTVAMKQFRHAFSPRNKTTTSSESSFNYLKFFKRSKTTSKTKHSTTTMSSFQRVAINRNPKYKHNGMKSYVYAMNKCM